MQNIKFSKTRRCFLKHFYNFVGLIYNSMNKLFYSFIMVFFFPTTAIFSQPLSQDTEQRILSFCKLYSTVKYYYPDPNLQDFPWDAFAYKGYKIAATSKNDKEFIKKIDNLFCTIAPGVQISKKEFNITHIIPKDTSLYSGKAFWQHQGGLNVGKPSFLRSTLNYIYKKPTNSYVMLYTLLSGKLQLLGKEMRISLWAKVEGQKDSVKVLRYKFANRKTKESTFIEIKAVGNEWKHYEKEFKHIDKHAFPADFMYLFHPKKGVVYVDNLKLEVKNGEDWKEIEIRNADFEKYSSLGRLGGWENMYALSSLSFADSINAFDGKYCLRLPVVQDRLFYSPVPIEEPHIVSLPDGHKAYIPLQLYADEKTVYPVSNKQKIEKFIKTLCRDSLNANQLAIACAMQTWAALYHDYPYRESDFENKINRLLIQTARKLETAKTADFYKILVNEFLLWINDPHLVLERGSKFLIAGKTSTKTANIPVKLPNPICLTENQCVVTNVIDSAGDLQLGDVVLQINDINIDSLLQSYRAHNISRSIQKRELERLIVTYGAPEIEIQLLRNEKIVKVVFSTDTRKKVLSMVLDCEKHQVLRDSLKEATDLFYLNAIDPPSAFNRNLTKDIAIILKRSRTVDSLITELNKYKALILDVRGRPEVSSILNFLNECMGIDLNREADVVKTVFFPVAQFKCDTLNLTLLDKREDMLINVPVYVLIDYNTVSAPERALLGLKESGRATFIGSNTAGAAGYVCKTKIADNITLTYTTGQIIGLDDNPMSYQGTGIAPDIYVYPTPQGIAEGRDEVLEKAIEIALKNIQGKD
jgi:C-terminal processing protease CtpA/Prc